MDRNGVDERLIKRGRSLLSLKFLESHLKELRGMNQVKAKSFPLVIFGDDVPAPTI